MEEVDVAENDDDIYGMPRDGQQGQIITPEQLSSALAFAGMTAGTNNSSSQSANSSTTDSAPSGFNGFREFLGSLLAADRPSSSPGILKHSLFNIRDYYSNDKFQDRQDL